MYALMLSPQLLPPLALSLFLCLSHSLPSSMPCALCLSLPESQELPPSQREGESTTLPVPDSYLGWRPSRVLRPAPPWRISILAACHLSGRTMRGSQNLQLACRSPSSLALFTHPLTHSFTHSLTHSFIHSFSHSLTHSVSLSLSHSPFLSLSLSLCVSLSPSSSCSLGRLNFPRLHTHAPAVLFRCAKSFRYLSCHPLRGGPAGAHTDEACHSVMRVLTYRFL